MRILLVEDEPRMANVIAKGLREHSYAVDVAEDGDVGLSLATSPQELRVWLCSTSPGLKGRGTSLPDSRGLRRRVYKLA
jgi:DNA-binding response OmpR family regulator